MIFLHQIYITSDFDMRTIDTILIHCTATPAGREVSSEELNRWHKASRFEPYTDPSGKKVYAGYHLLVHLDGTYERLRPDSARGQHCRHANMNDRAIAVCYVGGCDAAMKPADTRTYAQKRTLRSLVCTLKARYPSARVMGHRDVPGVRKACPCFDAAKEYS